jgi:tetratricopeptide (TPR) repeat protein
VYHEQWRFAAADASYRQAVALNPNYAPAHHWYAVYLVQMRRFDEAYREIDWALALDPASTAVATAKAVILYQSRDFAGAVRQFEKVLASNPTFVPAQSSLAEAYSMMGRHDDALRALARARTPDAVDERLRALEAYIRAAAGDRAGALLLLRQAEAVPGRPHLGEMDLAAAYAILGLTDQSQAAVTRAFRDRDDSLVFAAVEPRWDRLRTTPAFTALLSAMNLPTGAPS